MSAEAQTEIAIFAAGIAFNAGILVMAVRRIRADVNGLGKKLGRTIALLNRWADTDEKRNQVSDLLEGK